MNPAAPQSAIARIISREDLANLPIRRYESRVRVVATPAELDEALADFREESVVGLDTETRPAFKKGESHLPCLVQVATARAVYLFQLRRKELHPVVARLLADPRIVKAGVGLKHDLAQLKQVFAFEEKSVLDLGSVARAGGFVALERQRDVALPGRVVLHHVGEELLDREVHRVLQRFVEAGLRGEPADEVEDRRQRVEAAREALLDPLDPVPHGG